MRKRELELIAGLAEGTLEDETEARALIESSPKHRFEYETQRTAIEALRSVGPARLSDHERAALHRDVWTELQTSPAAASRSPWYYRWAYVAGGLLIVTIGLGTILSGGGDDAADTFGEVSAGLADDGAADETATTESASRAARAEELQEDSAGAPLAPLSSQVTKLFDERARLARSGNLQTFDSAGESGADGAAAHAECLAQTELSDYEVLGEISVEEARDFGLEAETPYIIAVPAGVALGPDTPVAFVESGTCVVVHTDG
jgi:hypothetical protein